VACAGRETTIHAAVRASATPRQRWADGASPGFDLWRRQVPRHAGPGRPEVDGGHPDLTSRTAFTVTSNAPAFVTFVADFSGDPTRTGGLVTFAGSRLLLSVVMFHQPHFRGQPAGRPVFRGYGLRGDPTGEPMAQASGAEIRAEPAHRRRPDAGDRARFIDGALAMPCRMPVITSRFMPRRSGDRPPVIPRGATSSAVMGRFCAQPRDCVARWNSRCARPRRRCIT
jgi:oleate hydratase